MCAKWVLAGSGESFLMRSKYIDIAKGIGIILIIIAHRCGFPIDIDVYLFAFTVQLFFVLAGYVYKDKYTFKEYVQARWKRIIIPYFQYNTILLCLFYLLGWKTEIEQGIWAVIGILYSTYCLYSPISTEDNIFFFSLYNGPTWFFTALFCSGIVFWWIAQKSNKEKLIFIGITILLTKPLGELPFFLPWSLDKVLLGASLMLIGYEVRNCKVFDMEWTWKKMIWVPGVGFVYFLLVSINPNINIATSCYGDSKKGAVLLCMVIGCLGTYLCVEVSKVIQNTLVGKVLEVVGNHTMLLLGFHLFLFAICEKYIEKYIPSLKGTYLRGYIEVILICVVIVGIDIAISVVKNKIGDRVKKHGK